MLKKEGGAAQRCAFRGGFRLVAEPSCTNLPEPHALGLPDWLRERRNLIVMIMSSLPPPSPLSEPLLIARGEEEAFPPPSPLSPLPPSGRLLLSPEEEKRRKDKEEEDNNNEDEEEERRRTGEGRVDADHQVGAVGSCRGGGRPASASSSMHVEPDAVAAVYDEREDVEEEEKKPHDHQDHEKEEEEVIMMKKGGGRWPWSMLLSRLQRLRVPSSFLWRSYSAVARPQH